MSVNEERPDLSAYPLTWPVGRPRTPEATRKRSKFGINVDINYAGGPKRKSKITTYVALTRLRNQFKLVRATDIVISSNVPTRNDGLPYSRVREPDDPGVAVYFRLKGEAHCLACDRWETVAENLNAIAKHIDAIRGQARWGVGDLAQAFAGYRALPAMGAAKPWWEVLELHLGPPPDAATARAKWMQLINKHHPDVGGTEAMAAEINAAWREAQAYYNEQRETR